MNRPAWHEPIWQGLRERMLSGQLAHAILFAGPAGLGKRALARALAEAALCQHPDRGEACGQCRACTLGRAGTHPDHHVLGLELNTQGNLRQEIVVDQVRALSATLSMTSQLGGRQVAIIDPADRLNHAAANALLKTLEEPARDTIMLLVADEAWRMPATVRSRCQLHMLRTPPPEVALAWLQQQGVEDAGTALAAAAGNPGLAQDLQERGLLDLHRQVREDLAALAQGRAGPFEVSQRWADEQATQRLWFAAREAAAEMLARAGRAQTTAAVSKLDDVALLDWYREATRARERLRGPLRPSLVLFPLLAAWH